MKGKIHPWALGISILIALFIIGTVILVIVISSEHYSLVEEDYYEEELVYQEQIDRLKRTQALEDKPAISFDQSSVSCTLLFPDSTTGSDVRGKIHFFRVSDSRHDFSRDIHLDESGREQYDMRDRESGQWIVKLSWGENGEGYYLEERIFIR